MPSSQTNFPFCIYWTNPALKTTSNGGQVTDAQGDDVVPYSDLALTVRYNDFEMVSYNGATGTIEMCVRASGGVGTTIYLGIGDPGISTFHGNAEAAWESNFKVVYHFGDGVTLSASDSTANSADGSITGATATTGKIGGGASFAGGSDTINSGDVANANFGIDAFTVSF
ncbi:MAG TPA: hypothetical protein VFR18_26135 [Terriglobia bacterium]|nr:hypothetical protein [Terriglobia bacterium]